MFRNLPLLLAALAIVLAIGGVARILFRPRRPVRGGFVESLPTVRIEGRNGTLGRGGNGVDVPSRDSIRTNFGHF